MQVLQPVRLQNVVIRGFWRDQLKRLVAQWLPHCIRQMEAGGRGQELLNLVYTAQALNGKETGAFTGCPWSDAYVYNTMEAASLALAIDADGDTELAQAQGFLRQKMEEWIPIILAAQMADGYIHSYHTVNRRPRYSDSSKHEFYVQGYFLELGVAHHLATQGKDRRLFDAARRCAEHLCATFGPAPKRTWVHGHPGIELALCRLGRRLEELEGPGHGAACFDLVQFLYDTRHTQARDVYNQTHLPAREQAEAVGHAVRAVYF